MTYRPLALVLLAVSGLAGCVGNGDDTCAYYGAPDYAPSNELRDPTTGVCQSFGGGDTCSDPCAPCPATGVGIAQPDWAQCYSSCEGLDENTCEQTSGCRAVYAGAAFYQCWATAPSGPVEGGDCSTFDAQECSRHDDCIARHATGTPIGVFQSCAAEEGPQDPGSCVGTVTCTTPQPACPANTIAGQRNGCWTGYCIPYAQCDQLPACSTLDEMSCIGRTDCAPTYRGINCSCDMTTGCSCQSWVFDACETK
jgi:hypothetical protein